MVYTYACSDQDKTVEKKLEKNKIAKLLDKINYNIDKLAEIGNNYNKSKTSGCRKSDQHAFQTLEQIIDKETKIYATINCKERSLDEQLSVQWVRLPVLNSAYMNIKQLK